MLQNTSKLLLPTTTHYYYPHPIDHYYFNQYNIMISLAPGAAIQNGHGNGGGGNMPATPLPPSACKTTTPATLRSSPRIAAKEAAKRCTTTAKKQVVPRLPKFRQPLPHHSLPPRPHPVAAAFSDDHEESQESHELLSPPPPVGHVTNDGVRIESQVTIPSVLGASFSDDDADDNDNVVENGNNNNEEDLNPNFFDNSGVGFNDDDDDDDDNEHEHDGMHGFSSGEDFPTNERCSYYMDRATITSSNRQAVEFVYMIEAETLCRGENTMKLAELKTKIFNRYKALIRAIPSSRFSEFGLQEKMVTKIFNSKSANGSAAGHYTKTMEVKAKVQAVIRQIPALPKLPSGRDIIDVRNDFILREYKSEMGEVRHCRSHLFIHYQM